MQTELSKKFLVKVVPHRHAQTERGLQWFKISFQLPGNSTQIPIPNQTRRNGVIGGEKYQTNNPTKPYIIPLKVMNSLKCRQ